MQLPSAFSIPELIWTTSAIIGLLAASFNIYVSRYQLGAVLNSGITNGKRIIAVGRFTRDVIRLAIQTIYTIAGIFAGHIPSNPNASGSTITWMLVATSILVTVMTMTDAAERYLTTHILADDTRSDRDAAEDLAMGTERRAMEQEHIEADS